MELSRNDHEILIVPHASQTFLGFLILNLYWKKLKVTDIFIKFF